MDYTTRFILTKESWKKFISGSTTKDDLIISNIIEESWQRCKKDQVNPYTKKVPHVLLRDELEKRITEHNELINICIPFMEHLYAFVKGSGFMIVLADSDGYLLKIIGDHEVLETVKLGNFIEGSCWSEEYAGTNGVGTVLKQEIAMQVFACEHYCITSHQWTCSGAPIYDSAKKLVGAIDMTGPYNKVHSHTLGMVAAAAYAIENQICLKNALTECQIADSFQKTVISSIPEMIMTIDNNGFISMMNENAKKIFSPDGKKIPAVHVNNFFGKNNDHLLNLIHNHESLTDVETRICFKGFQGDFTMCTNPIIAQNKTMGKIIILNEIKRTRTLVTNIIGAKANLKFDNIIGINADFEKTVDQAKIASRISSNVLLLGESGTGKDIFAQAIHNNSTRKDGPYVAVNCAAIPKDLISSELFGFSDGAFTGSRKGGNHGKFELADGGTIFLDEIGETPLEFQSTLLRVIEDKSITRIGGQKVISVDVRIIAATNRNLKEAVQQGKFREDLYYRLNVFRIQLPPLRERKDDIPLLTETFAKRISGAMGKTITNVDEDLIEKFINYPWPGNVRELQNVLERMINVSHTNTLMTSLLPDEIINYHQEEIQSPVIESIYEAEKNLIMKMMKSNNNKKDIAEKLRISRNTLYRRLQKYELE